MRLFCAALVGLVLFAANAAAQCQQCGPDCTCGPNCACTQLISAEEVITDGWHPLIGFPGQQTLYKNGKCLGVMYEGKFYARISKGVFANAASESPAPMSEYVNGSCGVAGGSCANGSCGTSASFQGGGCAGGNCGASGGAGLGPTRVGPFGGFRGRR